MEAASFVPARTSARGFLRGAFFGRTLFRGAFLGRPLLRGAVRFRLVVLLVFRSGVAGRSGRRGFPGVIGDIPAGAFELHGWRGDHLFDHAAAIGTLLYHLVGELLDFLEAVAALLALIFVKGHELSQIDSRVQVSVPSIFALSRVGICSWRDCGVDRKMLDNFPLVADLLHHDQVLSQVEFGARNPS